MNKYNALSIRTFIGAKDFELSKRFYKALGWEEIFIFPNMVLFHVNEKLAFYLQDAFVKDWVDNSMVFLEVDDVQKCWEELNRKDLSSHFPNVRLSNIHYNDWGNECFLHDPSGILWHFGEFNDKI